MTVLRLDTWQALVLGVNVLFAAIAVGLWVYHEALEYTAPRTKAVIAWAIGIAWIFATPMLLNI